METMALQILNHKVEGFERELIDLRLEDRVLNIKEGNFYTIYTFKNLNEEEIETIENITEYL